MSTETESSPSPSGALVRADVQSRAVENDIREKKILLDIYISLNDFFLAIQKSSCWPFNCQRVERYKQKLYSPWPCPCTSYSCKQGDLYISIYIQTAIQIPSFHSLNVDTIFELNGTASLRLLAVYKSPPNCIYKHRVQHQYSTAHRETDIQKQRNQIKYQLNVFTLSLTFFVPSPPVVQRSQNHFFFF